MLRIVVGTLAALALAAPAQAVEVKRVEIPAPDGTILRGTLRLPPGGARVPTIVQITPYSGAQSYAAEEQLPVSLAEAGYATLLVDVRGTGQSSGDFCFLCREDAQDGRAVVEWAARQPFSDGQVGMSGYSYAGVLAARTAAARPPHLRAVAIGSSYHDAYRDIVFPGGTLSTDAAALGVLFSAIPYSRFNHDTQPQDGAPEIAAALQRDNTVATDSVQHLTDDAFWQERSLEPEAPRIEVPALVYSGWHDVYTRGAPRLFRAIGSDEKALVMGNHGHLVDQAEYDRSATRWFDTYLRTRPGPARALAAATYPRVQLFDQGAGAGWRGYERWVPDGAPLTLRLCPGTPPPGGPWASGGTLAAAPCSGTAAVPATPPELTGGTSIATTGEPTDQDQRLAPYMAAFAGEPLTQPLTITGPLAVRFTARTYGADADWTARIVDIAPDGGTRLMARGWLKASHRRESNAQPGLYHSHVDPVLLTPGEPYELAIEVWPTSYRLPAGHRLGVLLGTSDAQKLLPMNESAASEILASPTAPATVAATRRTDPGAPLDAPFTAKLPAVPATDDEPCRPSFARARLRIRADGAHAGFRGSGPLVAETRDAAGRLVVRRTVRAGDLVWEGRGQDDERAAPGWYVTRLIAPDGPGFTTRRIALRLGRDGALRDGPRLERGPSCGLLRALSVDRPAFGGRPVTLSYTLRRAARVRVDTIAGGRVVRRSAERLRSAGTHALVIGPHGHGRQTFRVRVGRGTRRAEGTVQADG